MQSVETRTTYQRILSWLLFASACCSLVRLYQVHHHGQFWLFINPILITIVFAMLIRALIEKRDQCWRQLSWASVAVLVVATALAFIK